MPTKQTDLHKKLGKASNPAPFGHIEHQLVAKTINGVPHYVMRTAPGQTLKLCWALFRHGAITLLGPHGWRLRSYSGYRLRLDPGPAWTAVVGGLVTFWIYKTVLVPFMPIIEDELNPRSRVSHRESCSRDDFVRKKDEIKEDLANYVESIQEELAAKTKRSAENKKKWAKEYRIESEDKEFQRQYEEKANKSLEEIENSEHFGTGVVANAKVWKDSILEPGCHKCLMGYAIIIGHDTRGVDIVIDSEMGSCLNENTTSLCQFFTSDEERCPQYLENGLGSLGPEGYMFLDLMEAMGEGLTITKKTCQIACCDGVCPPVKWETTTVVTSSTKGTEVTSTTVPGSGTISAVPVLSLLGVASIYALIYN